MDHDYNLSHLNWKACEGLGALISTMVKLHDLVNVTYTVIIAKCLLKSGIKNKSFFPLKGFASFYFYFIYLFAENKNFYKQKQNINWASSLITSETEGGVELGSKKPKKSIWK